MTRWIDEVTSKASFMVQWLLRGSEWNGGSRLRAEANVFCVRELIGEGVPIVLQVEPSGRVNRAYSSDSVRSKLQPAIPWSLQDSH